MMSIASGDQTASINQMKPSTLLRQDLIDATLAALDDGKSVLLCGPDNVGKSTLMKQVFDSLGYNRHQICPTFIELTRRGELSECRHTLERCLRKIDKSLRRFKGSPQVDISNLPEVARYISQSNRRNCLFVDDLYRFEGQWHRYLPAKQVFDTIKATPDVRWIVADNQGISGFTDAFSSFVKVHVGFFNENESEALLRMQTGFNEEQLAGICKILNQAIDGCPYQLSRLVNLIRLKNSNVDEVPALLELFVTSTEQTVLKIMDYMNWRKDVRELVERAVSGKDKLRKVKEDDEDAANLLLSTGAFVLRPNCRRSIRQRPKQIVPSNLIFRHQLTRLFRAIDEESQISTLPVKKLPAHLQLAVQQGHDRNLLAHYATKRILIGNEGDSLNHLLKCVVALFEFRRASVFMCETKRDELGNPVIKRIVLSRSCPTAKILERSRRLPINWVGPIRWTPTVGYGIWL